MHATWGLGAAALIVFAMAGPVLSYGDGLHLAGVGGLLGLAVLAYHTVYIREGADRYLWLSVALTAGLTGGIAMIGEMMTIMDNARANDTRCADIQHDMLAAQPRRTDGPALFYALGCSPQGQQRVAFTAATSESATNIPSASLNQPAPTISLGSR
jgi:hypothetical protein